jgi:hypothetical protein
VILHRAIWPLLSRHKSLHLWQAVDGSFDLVHCVLHVKSLALACLAGAVAIADAYNVDHSEGALRR